MRKKVSFCPKVYLGGENMYKRFEYSKEKDHISENTYFGFKLCNPNLADKVVEWYDIGHLRIIVILNNGEVYEYDDMMETTTKLQPLDEFGYEELNEEQFKRNFIRKLNKLMNMKLISQSELAEACDTSQTMISHYLTGKSIPSSYMLMKIAKALQCHVDELM